MQNWKEIFDNNKAVKVTLKKPLLVLASHLVNKENRYTDRYNMPDEYDVLTKDNYFLNLLVQSKDDSFIRVNNLEVKVNDIGEWSVYIPQETELALLISGEIILNYNNELFIQFPKTELIFDYIYCKI